MAPTSLALHPAIERFEIHTATCRARRQQLVCSTCSDLGERAARVLACTQPLREVA